MTEDSRQLIVVGAGPAGCAAALEAAALGLDVTLVDEHPQTAAAMSLDAPYFYGARLAPELYNARGMAEQVLMTNEPLMACLEAGVELLTSTVAWGLFRGGPNSRHVGTMQLGLSDERQSWCIDAERLILATGARDLVLSFPGWELPGVLGVKAAAILLGTYKAFDGRAILILGSSNVALDLAHRALDHGLTVAGIVEPGGSVLGDDRLATTLHESGVPFFLGHTIACATGGSQVEGARLVPVDDGSNAVMVTCDTICMAYGVVPNVELAALAGATLAFDPARGGWSPTLDERMASDVPGIAIVGDAAGVLEAMQMDSALAEEQGRRAARAFASGAGPAPMKADNTGTAHPPTPVIYPPDAWLDSLVAAGGMEVQVCQCEEVTRRELVGLHPPRYLETPGAAPDMAVATAVVDGDVSQDMVKRMTRCGMGHCQGRRCREHAALLLARATGQPLASVVPGSYRAPVRPLPLNVLQAHDEDPAMVTRWPRWLHPVDGPPAGL